MKTILKSGMSAFCLVFALGLAACEKQGAMEEAGEKLDDKMDEIKDGMDPQGPAEKAGEAIDDAVDEAGEKMEEAGDKMQH